MIDIHSHILPGIDDGTKTVKDAIGLAKAYLSFGYTDVVATPHFVMGTRWAYTPDKIKAEVHQFKTILMDQNIKLKIHPGMEIAMDRDLPTTGERLLGLNGSRFLLIELPFQNIPGSWRHFMDNVIEDGFVPVIAHPERCIELDRQTDALEKLVAAGAGLQINWGSLMGLNGASVERFAWDLLERGWVHCLATDAHDLNRRPPEIVRLGLQEVENHLTKSQVKTLTVDNPQAILNNSDLKRIGPLAIDRPTLKKKKRWFSFLKRS